MTGQNQNEQFAHSAGTFTLMIILWFPGSFACVGRNKWSQLCKDE